MGLVVQYCSEQDQGVKVKYITPIIFSHTKGENVFKEMFNALEKLSITPTLMLSLGKDGPNVNKSIRDKLNQLKKEKGYK